VDPPLAGTRRILHLPGGAQLQTDDDAAVRALFPHSNRLETWVHGLEGRWPYALAGVVVAAVFSWWCIVYGLPMAAKLAAEHVPLQIEVKLGEQTLKSIDQTLCGKSTLGEARQQQLRRVLASMTAGLDDGYEYHLEFRSCPLMGANAFALPGGTLVVTGALGRLARDY